MPEARDLWEDRTAVVPVVEVKLVPFTGGHVLRGASIWTGRGQAGSGPY